MLPALLAPAAAADLIAGWASGAIDVTEMPEIVAVAVEEGGAAELEVPVLFPSVVVAVSAAAPSWTGAGPDVALTSLHDPPAPWVAVADPEEELAHLAERVAEWPIAALTLVQLLRSGAGRPVEEGLALESLAYSVLQSGPEFARWRVTRLGTTPSRARLGEDGEVEPVVLVDRHGDVVDVVLNRPEVHNAYNTEVRDALCAALSVAAVDVDLRVELSGLGPSFCSGGDLTEFGTGPDPARTNLVRVGRSPARLLAAIADRCQATIHGSCAGSGIELPAFASRVRARPGTRIWLPELSLGLVPGAGGTVSIPRRVGRGRTAWMVLSGAPIDERTAWAWGLVDEVAE